MRSLLTYLLVLFFSTSVSAFTKSQKSVEGLAGVYGYVGGQEYSLKIIESSYPELSQDITLARLRFDTTYPKVREKTKQKLIELFGEDANKITVEIDKKITEQLPKSISKNQAIDFINIVNNRANGSIENQSTRDFLLAVTYFDQPDAEFSADKVQKFTTKNEDKAKGLDINLTLPLSWAERQGNTPNTVRTWISEAGNGLSLVTLLVINTGDVRKKADIQKAIDRKDYSNLAVPAATSKVNKIIYSELSNQLGWYVEMEVQQQRIDLKLFSTYKTINVLFEGKTIQLSCSSGGVLSNKDYVLKESIRTQVLCRKVLNSLIINNVFK